MGKLIDIADYLVWKGMRERNSGDGICRGCGWWENKCTLVGAEGACPTVQRIYGIGERE